MKAIIAALLLMSSSAFAQQFPVPPTPVYPTVSHWGNSIQVEAWNQNRFGVSCSGWVYMSLASGGSPSHYVSMYVPGNGFRSVRVNAILNPGDRITNVSHSIWCN